MKTKVFYLIVFLLLLIVLGGFIFAQRLSQRTTQVKEISGDEEEIKSDNGESITLININDISENEDQEETQLTESEINNTINKLKEEEDKQNFDEITKYYEMLINLYPNNQNYIKYGKFLATNSKFKKADDVWRKCIEENYGDYKLIEDLYLSYQMHNYLLDIYLKAYKGEKKNTLKLSRKIITMYDVLGKSKEKADFIISLLKDGSESIFISHSSYVVQGLKNEDAYSPYLLGRLEDLVNDKDLPQHRKMSLKEKLAEVYIYNRQTEEAYQTYRSIITEYENQLEKEETRFFVIEDIINDAINGFLFIEKYDEAIVFIKKYLSLLEDRSPVKYAQASIELSNVYSAINKPNDAMNTLTDALSHINKLTEKDNETPRNYSLQRLTMRKFEIYYDIASINFNQRKFNEAIKYLNKIEYADKYKNHYVLLGRCYLAIDDVDKAKEHFNKSVMKFSSYDNYQTVYYLATTSILEGNIMTALNYYEEIIQNSKIEESEYAIESLIKYDIVLSINDESRLKRFIEFEKLRFNFKLEETLLTNPIRSDLEELYTNLKIIKFINKLFKIESNHVDNDSTTNTLTTTKNNKNNFNYENIYSDNDYEFVYEEDFYIYFEIIDILLDNGRIKESALLLFRDIVKFDKTKNIANGFYYQKAVYLLCKIYLDYYLKGNTQNSDLNSSKFDYVKNLLLNLLIEFPDTIYLNKIKKLVDEIE
jgi:tetratricopeptide (TPR) repeat protein